MVEHQKLPLTGAALRATGIAVAFATIVACTASTGNDAGVIAASCTMPGVITMGPADTHCGTTMQHVDPASCNTVVADDAGGTVDGGAVDACVYGDTMYGTDSDDDDCKYHVTWSNLTPICEGAGGVTFKVVVTAKDGSQAGMGAKTRAQVFMSSPADAGCDMSSNHTGPNNGVLLKEGPSSTYTGQIVFDSPGLWTVRFHFHEDCFDSPASPHGHAAYHVTVQ